MLGSGLVEGTTTFWEEERARAVYTDRPVSFDRQGQLYIIGKLLETEQEQKKKARLKVENEQQLTLFSDT